MQPMKWLAVLMALAVIASCFFPWVIIPETHIIISGFHSDYTGFGKPGIMHVFFCSLFILLILLHKNWSLRTAFFLSAFNIAWAGRNYFLVSSCRAGTCPDKQAALYILLACSLLMAIFVLFVRPGQSPKTAIASGAEEAAQ